MTSPKRFCLVWIYENGQNIISYHTVYVIRYFCAKNLTACTLRVTLTTLMLPVPLSFCVQTNGMAVGWVLNIPLNRITIDDWQWGRELCWRRIVDVEAAPFHGLIIAYGIMHYKQLSAYSCVSWFVPLECMSVQILLCEKIKISVTNMQTDNSKSLNLWKFHENGIN